MKYAITCNGKLLTTDYSNILGFDIYDPLNPLDLPPLTLRAKYKYNTRPNDHSHVTSRLYDYYNNIWDLTFDVTYWSLTSETNMIEVLGANSTGVTLMTGLFSGCSSLTKVALFDTSSVTNMSYMFSRCTSLNDLPLFNTSNVTSMTQMFYKCSSLNAPIPQFDMSNVTDTTAMFEDCTSLSSIPSFDLSAVTAMSTMFKNCTALLYIPYTLNLTSVVNMNSAFYNCISVRYGSLDLYQRVSTQTTPPMYHSSTFYKCGSTTQSGAAELAQIPNDWK